MRKVALRNIRAHIGRFLLSLLAVTLGVAFVAGTFSLRTAMSGSFDAIVDSSDADAYIRPTPEEGASIVTGSTSNETVDPDVALEAEQVDGVDYAFPSHSVTAVLVGADGTAVQSTQAPSMVILLDPRDEAWWDITDGRAPEGTHEVALEAATFDTSGLAIGDTTTVIAGGQRMEVEVVGRIESGVAMMGASIVLMEMDAGLELLAPGGVSSIAVYVEDGADIDQVVEDLEPLATGNLQVISGDDLRQESKDQIEDVLGFMTVFLLVFAAIALFVGAFIISNTFAMSVRQRMREFALLRAVGASPRQVFSSILVEAAVVGVVGSVVGLLGGLGLVQGISAVMETFGMTMSDDLPVSVSTVVISLLVGTLVSVLAAALPARRAALVPPVEAMRDDVSVPEKSLHRRAWIGLVLVLLGAAGVLLAALRPEEGSAGGLYGAGAAAVVFGVLMLSPVMARAVITVLAWPFVQLIRPVGRLARGNVVRNPRRTANTAGALMIGMALVGAVSVLATSVKVSVADIVESQIHADMVLSPASGTIPQGVTEDVAALPEVASAEADYFGMLPVAGPDADASAEVGTVMGVKPGFLGGTIDATTVEGDLGTLDEGQVAVSKSTASAAGWEVGDTVRITAASGSVEEYRVGAVFSLAGFGASWLMAYDDFSDVLPVDQQLVDLVTVQAADGVSDQQLKDAVVEAVKPYVVVSVFLADEFVSSMSEQVDQMMLILYALLALSVIIAVLGIVNTLALSVIERTREIGLLRAVGLGRLQLSGTVVVESVLTAVYGTVIGLLVGVGLAAALPRILEYQGLTSLAIGWGQLVAMLVLSVVVGVVAALWPAVRAARMNVLDAVSYG